LQIPPIIRKLAAAFDKEGGRLYVVGGGVRDHCLGLPASDMDLEVHGLTTEVVGGVLNRFGYAKEVGKSFNVFKLRYGAEEIDVALPRTRRAGVSDPFLGLPEATRRRDLTINALLYDVLDEQILDLQGGLEDLRAGILRECAPDTFREDPLRALRAVRFSATLGFELAPSLRALCAEADLSQIPGERLRAEAEKMLLNAPRPGVGLRGLLDVGLLDVVFPGLAALSPEGHPAALDRAAPHRDGLEDPADRYALMFAAALYPGGPRAREWLERLRINRVRRRSVRQLIMALIESLPPVLAGPSDADLRRLADLAPLALTLRLADAIQPGALDLEARAAALGVSEEPLPRLVDGAALAALGVPGGPQTGRILAAVRAAQHRGEVSTDEQALALARALRDAGNS
jgi:tRNA nucleotidyltransferase/poly(A) polymerase